ncbi:MAG TPA: hypothetical protein DHW82_11025 [Spirochaetia bacterium]|nr:MAG: hypothetical protein A2Y41_01145 [Spirochaetes bacterium GWB1_36_13]HCL57526.1 hypothetical protein [Spirochaetia bacterium]
MTRDEIKDKRFYKIFIFVFFLFVFYFAFRVFMPYMTVLIIAVILTGITYPVFRFFLKITKHKNTLAAVLTCVFVILAVLIPMLVLTLIIADQSKETYFLLSEKLQSGALDEYFNLEQSGFIQTFINQYSPFKDQTVINIKAEVIEFVKSFSSTLVNNTAKVLSNIGSFIASLFLMVFTMFFLYKDGTKFVKILTHLSPMPTSYENRIAEKFTSVSRSIFIGVFFTAILQGFLDGIAFAIVGISPWLWAIFLAFASIIPIVGTAVIWLPAGIVLIAMGQTGSAVFLMIWCFLVSIGVENFIKPILIKGKSGLHPLLIFFSILGGIQFFGFVGILLGPIIISIFVLILEIYEEEYRPTLERMDKK